LIDLLFVAKLAFTFIITIFLIHLLIQYAPKIGLVDIPNHRSYHKKITPRGAGIGIILGIILSDLLFMNPLLLEHATAFIAIFLVFLVGVLDDHRDVNPKTKFIVIFLAVLLLYLDDICIKSLGTFFGYEVVLGWFALPFTMFAVAGFTNALNLSDGLDGLAGSLSIIILSTLCSIGYMHNDTFIISVSLSFIAAISAFMWFNWNPAKIFMGDSGSLSLGFVIAVLSIKALAYIQPTAILFIAAIPIIDTLVVMVRRKRNGKSIFSPDKLHIHHILLRFLQGNIRTTVILIGLMQIGFSIIGISLSEYPLQCYTLLLFAINVVIFYILLNAMLLRQNKFSYYRRKGRRK